MYANHQSMAQRLLRAQKLDNENYLAEINHIFANMNIRLKPDELKELLYGFNGSEEELLKKPLSKLARDILSNKKD